MVILRNWYSLIKDPGSGKMYLGGDAFGHPLRGDGEGIITSRILYYNPAGNYFRCISRVYFLEGPASEEYLEHLRIGFKPKPDPYLPPEAQLPTIPGDPGITSERALERIIAALRKNGQVK